MTENERLAKVEKELEATRVALCYLINWLHETPCKPEEPPLNSDQSVRLIAAVYGEAAE